MNTEILDFIRFNKHFKHTELIIIFFNFANIKFIKKFQNLYLVFEMSKKNNFQLQSL